VDAEVLSQSVRQKRTSAIFLQLYLMCQGGNGQNSQKKIAPEKDHSGATENKEVDASPQGCSG
jgi:hypothetical protein